MQSRRGVATSVHFVLYDISCTAIEATGHALSVLLGKALPLVDSVDSVRRCSHPVLCMQPLIQPLHFERENRSVEAL